MLIWTDPKIEAASQALIKDLEGITDPHFLMYIGEIPYTKDTLLNELIEKTEVGLDLANNYINGLNFFGNV